MTYLTYLIKYFVFQYFCYIFLWPYHGLLYVYDFPYCTPPGAHPLVFMIPRYIYKNCLFSACSICTTKKWTLRKRPKFSWILNAAFPDAPKNTCTQKFTPWQNMSMCWRSRSLDQLMEVAQGLLLGHPSSIRVIQNEIPEMTVRGFCWWSTNWSEVEETSSHGMAMMNFCESLSLLLVYSGNVLLISGMQSGKVWVGNLLHTPRYFRQLDTFTKSVYFLHVPCAP